MEKIEEFNAVISGVSISNEDHGCLSMWVYLDFGGSGQGFGGYSLYTPDGAKSLASRGAYAGHFIWRCLEVAGVGKVDQMKGKCVRVRASREKVHAIGHIIKNIWFNPTEEFAEE